MKIRINAFYDKKSKRYDTPFFTQDEIATKRHFIMAIRSEGTLLNQFKDDFEVHYLGLFDVDKGLILVDNPQTVMCGDQIAKEER